MAAKIFSHNSVALNNDYVQPEYSDVDDTSVFLLSYDDKEFLSYDDSKVTVQAPQGDYEVKVYDKGVADDQAVLDAVKAEATTQGQLRVELQAMEDAFMTGKSQVEVLAGVSAGTAAIVDGLAKVETDKAAHITALGF